VEKIIHSQRSALAQAQCRSHVAGRLPLVNVTLLEEQIPVDRRVMVSSLAPVMRVRIER
jgi:hypothetical protein